MYVDNDKDESEQKNEKFSSILTAEPGLNLPTSSQNENIELDHDNVDSYDRFINPDSEYRKIKVNRQLQEIKFKKNSISTSKYNILTFIPKFLFEQFQKYSNIFFFVIVMFQQIPDVSPTGRFTTLIPLLFIMGASMIKEIIEDFKRRKSDSFLNNKPINVLRSNGLVQPHWEKAKWKNLVVGDIVKISAGEQFPCDLFLISSSEPNSICYLQTSNLDGETNLKIRQALKKTSDLTDSVHLRDFNALIECELPNQRLYEFTGNLKIPDNEGTIIPIGPDQILLRGSLLQNTKWIYGVVIYTGHETKLMMNSSTPPFKRSQVEKTTNTQIMFLFLLLLLIALFSAVCSEIWHIKNKHRHWYIGFDDLPPNNFPFTFLTFIILYNNLIPISLQVTLEFVKFLQAYFINWDEEMYDKENNFYAVARTSNLNEELGQIKYVFSDKTGTLTCNKMEFKRCSIAGICYGSGNEEEFNSYELLKNLNGNHNTCDMIYQFLTLLATCHTVIPEKKPGTNDIDYQASSPDEAALVKAMQKLGIVFYSRQPEKISVKFLSIEHKFEILNVLEFNSVRKRMSVILRDKDGVIKIFCKGADNVMLQRASTSNQEYINVTIEHLEMFAKDGLRTLVLAYRVISDDEYQAWNEIYIKAATSLQNRDKKCQSAAELIERDLIILGATAIEDKLQIGVPRTISMLLQAGIKVWVLTGDKIETAVNIGYSCKLLSENTSLIYLVDDNMNKLKNIIKNRLSEIPEVRRGKENPLGLIIDGKALLVLLSEELQNDFLLLATSCCTVVCCRATPKNKAQLVEFVKIRTKECTLAIGDGANDVSMIQAAHVGIGIYGCEGTQALSASDYAIGQFRFLSQLLFVHGIWNYKRLCKVILYSYYKNICLYVIELWYAFSNGFSGQILFERWLIGLYNVFFTALPPLALGLFDRPTKADTMLRFPELYKITQSKSDFNMKVFWTWIFNSFLHSIMIYFSCYGALRHDIALSDGSIGDYLFMGCHVYTYCVIVVCLKSGLETDSWTKFTHLSIWGSIGMWFLFLIMYSHFWPTLGLAPEMTYMEINLFRGAFFWLGIIFVPIYTLLPDVFYKSLQRTMYKTEPQAIQEREAKDQDLETLIRRSKISETARLLKSAFTFSRSQVPHTAYRGFAFSQEENGAVKQSDLIRKYDTDIDKPTGN